MNPGPTRRILASELRKIFSRRLSIGFTAIACAFSALPLLLIPLMHETFSQVDAAGAEEMTEYLGSLKGASGVVFAVQNAINGATLWISIFVAVATAGEYSSGTLGLTYVREPRRSRVLTAKLAAFMIYGVVTTALAALAAIAAGLAAQPLLDGVRSSYEGAWPADAMLVFARGIPAVAIWVAIPVFVATITRNAAAAAAAAVVASIVDGMLLMVKPLTPVLLSANVQALLHVEGVDPTGPLNPIADIGIMQALAYILLVTASLVATTDRVVRRQDL